MNGASEQARRADAAYNTLLEAAAAELNGGPWCVDTCDHKPVGRTEELVGAVERYVKAAPQHLQVLGVYVPPEEFISLLRLAATSVVVPGLGGALTDYWVSTVEETIAGVGLNSAERALVRQMGEVFGTPVHLLAAERFDYGQDVRRRVAVNLGCSVLGALDGPAELLRRLLEQRYGLGPVSRSRPLSAACLTPSTPATVEILGEAHSLVEDFSFSDRFVRRLFPYLRRNEEILEELLKLAIRGEFPWGPTSVHGRSTSGEPKSTWQEVLDWAEYLSAPIGGTNS